MKCENCPIKDECGDDLKSLTKKLMTEYAADLSRLVALCTMKQASPSEFAAAGFVLGYTVGAKCTE